MRGGRPAPGPYSNITHTPRVAPYGPSPHYIQRYKKFFKVPNK